MARSLLHLDEVLPDVLQPGDLPLAGLHEGLVFPVDPDLLEASPVVGRRRRIAWLRVLLDHNTFGAKVCCKMSQKCDVQSHTFASNVCQTSYDKSLRHSLPGQHEKTPP